MRAVLGAIVMVAGLGSVAHADGFFEVVTGLAIPVADDDYEASVDETFKLGVRAGSAAGKRGGLELGLDWTPYENDSNDILTISLNRFRALIGGRFSAPIGRRARGFGRVAAGADIVRGTAEFMLAGIQSESSETDVGLALEFGGGVAFDVGKVSLGFQLAIPLAFHFDENDPLDSSDIPFDYTGVDIDLLGFVQFAL